MARKPVLSGGKRDEITDAAMKLFFERGYEATSVRAIMDKAGGEIGMFYHYFKSKDELFDRVVQRFFSGFSEKCTALLSQCGSLDDFIDVFLPLYSSGMQQFEALKGKMHWSVQYAMHAITVESMVPAVAARLAEIRGDGNAVAGAGRASGDAAAGSLPTDILAAQLVHGISATLHSPAFEAMSEAGQKECLRSYIYRVVQA